MPVNSFFLQGSQGEQRLVQDIINEQLRMYGIEVLYLPRKIVKTDNIFREVESSSFSDNFAIEAYVNTYEGYSGAGDVLTKFGMNIRDEVTLTISKERFEDFISPFMAGLDDGTDESEIILSSRPAMNGAIKSSNLSLDIVRSTSSRILTPNLVNTSPAPEYPS